MSTASSPSSGKRRKWFSWQHMSDISMSEADVDDDDTHDDIVMNYSESSEHSERPEKIYPTGASAFRNRQESKSSHIVRFQGTDDTCNDSLSTFDEERPPQRHLRHATRRQRQHHLAPSSPPPGGVMWNAVSNLALAVHRSPASGYSGRHKKMTHAVHFEPLSQQIDPSRKSNSDSSKRLNIDTERSPLLLKHPQQHPHSDSPNQEFGGNFHKKKKGQVKTSGNGAPPEKRKQRRAHEPATVVRRRNIEIAAAFLRDCERNRRPSLPSDLQAITDGMLTMCRWKYSMVWIIMVNIALVALFLSCCNEKGDKQWYSHSLHAYAIFILVMDMVLGSELRKAQQAHTARQTDAILNLRQSRLEYWTVLLAVLLFILTLEVALGIGTARQAVWSSALKPIALFYVSNQAKDALEALNRIGRLVVNVIFMELFVILSFAAVASRLYVSYESFSDLSTAFLSLFQLSTTVVNPSMWMPMYSASRSSAFFFVFFVVTSVFYLHSLVLSVVFQTYVQASADIHERSMSDRDDAIRLAFLALRDEERQDSSADVVQIHNIRKVLQLLRPHYSPMKINALVEIMDPSNHRHVGFASFRVKIRQALNTSVRTARNPAAFSVFVELVAACVAVVNFAYVMLFTSAFHAAWFDAITVWAGAAITFLGLFELTVRLNPWHVFQFTPITRLNVTFDGIATIAALISLRGLFNYLTGGDLALELILTGRAVDMIRAMRFFPMFRDVVRRSSDVFPALAGPVILVLSSIHVFTYIGMALWGGAVEVGEHSDIVTPLYDLNNFNSYSEGMVTMFQVLVVNDWHAIAEVFLYATKCASPYVVYPFFVIANLVNVSILLNCLTAFFVGAFVTKIHDDVDVDSEEVVTMRQRTSDFAIDHSQRNFRRMSSHSNLREHNNHEHDDDDEGSTTSSDLYEFDVYERQGYDTIMQTVAGVGSGGSDYAKEVCDFLEVFEGLSPGRPRVGYMVCCQQTMSRFGNRRFQTVAQDYIDESALHMVVSDMHAELLVLAGKNSQRSLVRQFPHLSEPNKQFELAASLIRQQPAVSLFVGEVIIAQ